MAMILMKTQPSLKMPEQNKRIFNFGAGPAMLPEEILLEAQHELLSWSNSGISILETGHRTRPFEALLESAESQLRTLLNIPADYHVLFLGTPARHHFGMIPMNFLNQNQLGAYLITGIWSQMAYQEALMLKKAYVLASTESTNFKSIPDFSADDIQENTNYLYFTPNETVNGIQTHSLPLDGQISLVADMTSCLLMEPIDVSKYALIFAGAQKNIANAGMTVVIVRDDFLQQQQQDTPLPSAYNYALQAKYNSLYATPPTFNIYLAEKMFRWIASNGGVDSLYKLSQEKARALYQYIDASEFYSTDVAKDARSRINICFRIKDESLEAIFIQKGLERGIAGIKGHRKVGGLRASLYNAMPIAGVHELIAFMHEFEQEHTA